MEKPKNSKKKWWIGIPVCILVILLILILLIPSYLSTDSGKRWIISLIENNTGGRLEIDNISLGWFHEQQIDKLQFSDQKGGNISFG